MKHLIVISSYNSEETILDVIVAIKMHLPNYDTLVIDRGSTDRTKNLLKNNQIRHLNMPLPGSYYDAISLGLMYAYDHNYEAVIEFDEHGTFTAEDILYLISVLENKGPDFVLVSRYGPHWQKRSWTKGLSYTSRFILHKQISDPTMRFRVYGSRAIAFFANENFYNKPTPDRIVQLIRNGYTFIQAHVEWEGTMPKLKTKDKFLTWGENWGWIFSILLTNPFRKWKLKRGKDERN